jgi:hypothetical protein
VELVDEIAAVGEDEHTPRARGLHESERGDGLAGAGRVLEPEALGGPRILGLLLHLGVGVECLLLPVLRLLVGLFLLVVVLVLVTGDGGRGQRRVDRNRRGAVPVAVGGALGLRHQRGQRA